MLRLETLGALRLSRDGVELLSTASQPRRLLLLAVVAGSGDLGIPRARLLALLWPESDESHARNALKQALFSLRRDLGLDVVTGPATLKLDPATCTSDVGEMLSSAARSDADRVISLDRGPFLDGIFGGDSPGLEEWIAATRLRVDEAVEAAFGKLASLAAARGVHAEAAHHLASLALRRPLDSAVAMRLIRALEAGGDAAAALMSAERHEAALWRELQLTPDPAFIALMRDVRERAARATIDAVTTGAPPPVRHEGRAAEPAAPPASLARSRAEPQRATRFLFMGALAIVAAVAAVSWSPERRSRGLELADASALPPDVLFDKQWALTVLDRAFTALESELSAEGKSAHLEVLKPWLIADADHGAQTAAAATLGVSATAVRVIVHRLRQRYREAVRAELRQTLAPGGSVEEELRQLFAALAA